MPNNVVDSVHRLVAASKQAGGIASKLNTKAIECCQRKKMKKSQKFQKGQTKDRQFTTKAKEESTICKDTS